MVLPLFNIRVLQALWLCGSVARPTLSQCRVTDLTLGFSPAGFLNHFLHTHTHSLNSLTHNNLNTHIHSYYIKYTLHIIVLFKIICIIYLYFYYFTLALADKDGRNTIQNKADSNSVI